MRADLPRAAQIHVEMHRRGHCAEVAGNVAIDSIGRQQSKRGWESSRTGRHRIRGPIVEDTVSVIISAGGDVVGQATRCIELRRELGALGQVVVADKEDTITGLPIWRTGLALVAVCRLGKALVVGSVGGEVEIQIAEEEAKALIAVLIEAEKDDVSAEVAGG